MDPFSLPVWVDSLCPKPSFSVSIRDIADIDSDGRPHSPLPEAIPGPKPRKIPIIKRRAAQGSLEKGPSSPLIPAKRGLVDADDVPLLALKKQFCGEKVREKTPNVKKKIPRGRKGAKTTRVDAKISTSIKKRGCLKVDGVLGKEAGETGLNMPHPRHENHFLELPRLC